MVMVITFTVFMIMVMVRTFTGSVIRVMVRTRIRYGIKQGFMNIFQKFKKNNTFGIALLRSYDVSDL